MSAVQNALKAKEEETANALSALEKTKGEIEGLKTKVGALQKDLDAREKRLMEIQAKLEQATKLREKDGEEFAVKVIIQILTICMQVIFGTLAITLFVNMIFRDLMIGKPSVK